MLASEVSASPPPLKQTPLHALHVARGGKMVPFAGYDMPVQFRTGVLKEHLHTRASCGLFDVSHMGQIALRPKSGRVEDAARALEWLVPQDILALAPGRQRYALFTNEAGGILDDLMVANFGDHLFLVVNAACKAEDEAHLREHLSDVCVVEPLPSRALIALQGPKAESVLAKFDAEIPAMKFMDTGPRRLAGLDCFVSRSGYTGEDGFEISVPAEAAESFAKELLANEARAADRARRPGQPQIGGRALSLRPRSRSTDDAGRGRAGMVDPKEPPQGRRAARRFSRRERDPEPVRTRRAAPPGRVETGRPRPGARRRRTVC